MAFSALFDKLKKSGKTDFDLNAKKEWLMSLKVGDKIDFQESKYANGGNFDVWYICIIKAIDINNDNNDNNGYRYQIAYDGWSSKWDVWVDINDVIDENNKEFNCIQPLHTFTPYHDYDKKMF